MQVRQQVAEGLASTRCGVSGIRSSLLHSPDMLKKGLQLLLVVLRLSTAACEAAIGSSFPQVRCQQNTLCCNALMLPNIATVITHSTTIIFLLTRTQSMFPLMARNHTSCVQMQSAIWFTPGLAQTCFGTAAAWQAQVVTYLALSTKDMHLCCCVNVCSGTDGCSRFTTWSLGNAVLGSSGEGRSWTPHQLASCRQGSQRTPSQVDTDVQAACTKPAGDQYLPAHLPMASSADIRDFTRTYAQGARVSHTCPPTHNATAFAA